MELVRLTVVANPEEAELVRSLLETEGIDSLVKQTDFGAGSMDGYSGGQQEILVSASDLPAARALIATGSEN
jgi:Putative prokaryotic signal transducing protein